MSFIYVFGLFALIAYIIQLFLGMQQIKHFNLIYQQMRRQGKVAIGRRSGKIQAGTIVMFAVDKQGMILDSVKMQGISVMAKFKKMPEFIGEDIHYLDHYNPILRKQNRLLVQAITNAREIYVRVAAGNYVEEKAMSPLSGVMAQIQLTKLSFQRRLKRSVK